MLQSLNASRLSNAYAFTPRRTSLATPTFRGNSQVGARRVCIPGIHTYDVQIHETYGSFVVPSDVIRHCQALPSPIQAINGLAGYAEQEKHSYYGQELSQELTEGAQALDELLCGKGVRPVKVEFIQDGDIAHIFITPLPQGQDETFTDLTKEGVAPEATALPY